MRTPVNNIMQFPWPIISVLTDDRKKLKFPPELTRYQPKIRFP